MLRHGSMKDPNPVTRHNKLGLLFTRAAYEASMPIVSALRPFLLSKNASLESVCSVALAALGLRSCPISVPSTSTMSKMV